ncbi:MAG TPA: hypothetical protein VNU68_31425 [Verrucomicrobiae bacterium]|nr:hypothetical protein [Verrucomicrobiae bacterium]
MLDDLFERLAAVFSLVFQLARQFSGSFALKYHPHVLGREMPLGMARRHAFAGKVLVLVTVPALERIEAFAVRAAFHVLQMRMTVFALQRRVSSRMAIHAARMHEYWIRGKKGGA